jgi:GAF domain-containing protein
MALPTGEPAEIPDLPGDVLPGLLESLSSGGSLDDLLGDVADLASAAIPDADGASVACLRDGRVFTFVATDEKVRAADEAQYGVEDGPCVEAAHDGEIHLSQHLADDARWPTLAAAAGAQGLGSLLAVPIANTDRPLGSLNLYARRPDAFGDLDKRTAVGFAQYAGYAIHSARERDEARRLAEQLAAAMHSHAVIDQAIGVLVVREGITPEGAMELMRAASQRANVKVREIAVRIMQEASGAASSEPASSHDQRPQGSG